MPEAPLRLGPIQSDSYEELAGGSPAAINAVVDALGAVRRRPGFSASALAPSATVDAAGIHGLHVAANGLVLATSGFEAPGKIYRLTPAAAVQLGSPIFSYQRPQFAETEAIVAISGVGTLRRVDLASPYAHTALGGSPPNGSQIISHAGRLLTDDPNWNGRINYSAPAAGSSTAGHEQWGAVVTALGNSGFFTAEARPDRLVALRDNTNEVAAFGATSTQFFVPDAAFVYVPLSTKEYGCSASASVVRDEESYAWLDHRRRFVMSDGRSFQEIGAPVRAAVEGFSRVDDCFGLRVIRRFFDGIIWTFPSEGVSLVFQKDAGWSTWLGWSTSTNNYAPLGFTAAANTPDASEVLVGTSTGTIRKLDFESQTDEGDPVPFSVTTGFQNHQTDLRKQCLCLRLTLRRGVHVAQDGEIKVEYRDDPGSWVTARTVGLGKTGDREPVIHLRGLGVYRRRQWRITATGSEELTIASAVEEIRPLTY